MGKVKGGNIIYAICRFWGDCWFFLLGIYHKNIYERPHDRNKQYIFVSNHISYFDIPVMMKAVRGQRIRILGKSEMAKAPLFGFIYKIRGTADAPQIKVKPLSILTPGVVRKLFGKPAPVLPKGNG